MSRFETYWSSRKILVHRDFINLGDASLCAFSDHAHDEDGLRLDSSARRLPCGAIFDEQRYRRLA